VANSSESVAVVVGSSLIVTVLVSPSIVVVGSSLRVEVVETSLLVAAVVVAPTAVVVKGLHGPARAKRACAERRQIARDWSEKRIVETTERGSITSKVMSVGFATKDGQTSRVHNARNITFLKTTDRGS
jgi:hypothetical protein